MVRSFANRTPPVALLCILAAACGVGSCADSENRSLLPSAGPPVELTNGWQFRADDGLRHSDDGRIHLERAREAEWTDIGRDAELFKPAGVSQVWFRFPLPEHDFPDPALFFAEGDGAAGEIFIDGRPVYRNGLDRFGEISETSSRSYYPELIALPREIEDRYVYICGNAPEEYEGTFNVGGNVLFGSRHDLLGHILLSETPALLIGSIFLTLGLVAGALYLRRWRQRPAIYGAFALMSLSAALSVLAWTRIVHVLLPLPGPTWRWLEISGGILLPVGVLLFYEQIFGAGPLRIIRRLWQIFLVADIFPVVIIILFLMRIPGTIHYLVNAAITIAVVFFVLQSAAVLSLVWISGLEAWRRGGSRAYLFFAGSLVLTASTMPALIYSLEMNQNRDTEIYLHFGLLVFTIFVFFVGEDYLTSVRRELRTFSEKLETTRRELQEAKLKSLQDRMSPHFLFNSLNTIHAMMFVDLDAAKRALLSLADNYRFLIDLADQPLIAFDDEWNFVENFTELNRIRFQGSLDLKLSREGDFHGVRIPPITLQPLVENALQHGFRKKRGGRGKLHVHAGRRGAWVRVLVEDDGSGLEGARVADLFGRSLGNIRSRLSYFFRRSFLILRERDSGGVQVLLCFRDLRKERS